MAANGSDSEEDGLNLFQEPEGYYQAEKQPTTAVHRLRDGREVSIRLVGHNALWGHFLWNAGRCIADFLEDNAAALAHGKTVLELGAGGGLPSLVAALHGAHTVLITDYPDADLIANLSSNIATCHLLPRDTSISARGYLWGASVEDLLSVLPQGQKHQKLVSSVQQTLAHTADAQALVFFTPYRPWLLEKDLAFFDLARAGGFRVDKVLEHVMEKVMFEEDPGDELLRRTVFGYRLTWSESG